MFPGALNSPMRYSPDSNVPTRSTPAQRLILTIRRWISSVLSLGRIYVRLETVRQSSWRHDSSPKRVIFGWIGSFFEDNLFKSGVLIARVRSAVAPFMADARARVYTMVIEL